MHWQRKLPAQTNTGTSPGQQRKYRLDALTLVLNDKSDKGMGAWTNKHNKMEHNAIKQTYSTKAGFKTHERISNTMCRELYKDERDASHICRI